MKTRSSWLIPILIAIVMLTACGSSKLHERYHFPGVRDGRVVNYYRVDVTGSSQGSQLRYISGFFDSDALNRYFNTFSQPDNGAILSWTSSEPPEISHIPVAEERVQADPANKGRKLVLLMSQNSEAIAEQIGTLAQSESFATIVGRTVFKDELAEIERTRLDSQRLDLLVQAAGREAEILAGRLRDAEDMDSVQARDRLLALINQAAAAAGATRPFSTFTEARDWLASRRATLIGGSS